MSGNPLKRMRLIAFWNIHKVYPVFQMLQFCVLCFFCFTNPSSSHKVFDASLLKIGFPCNIRLGRRDGFSFSQTYITVGLKTSLAAVSVLRSSSSGEFHEATKKATPSFAPSFCLNSAPLWGQCEVTIATAYSTYSRDGQRKTNKLYWSESWHSKAMLQSCVDTLEDCQILCQTPCLV